MKKTLAIILELVPLISAPVACGLIVSPLDSPLVRIFIDITMLFAVLGFVFNIIGRKLAKESKLVRVLGVLDCITPILVVAFYILAIFCFGL